MALLFIGYCLQSELQDYKILFLLQCSLQGAYIYIIHTVEPLYSGHHGTNERVLIRGVTSFQEVKFY